MGIEHTQVPLLSRNTLTTNLMHVSSVRVSAIDFTPVELYVGGETRGRSFTTVEKHVGRGLRR